MAKRFTDTAKWEDPWFRSLPGIAKLVFLYVIDRCDNAGFWEKDMDAMSWHTKLKPELVEGAMKHLSRGLVEADGWVWVRRFVRHQKNEDLNANNPAHRQIIAMIKEQVNRFSSVPEFNEFIEPYKGLLSPLKGACNAPLMGIGKVKEEDKSDMEEGMQGEKPPKPKRSKQSSAKGTRDELKAYAEEIGQPASDGDGMYDHWESNGWRTGRNPIKDWRAAMNTWKRNGWLPSQKVITHFSGKSNQPADPNRFANGF